MSRPVATCIRERRSVRAYTDQQIDKETIIRILDAARFSPSGANTQPWQVAVLTGEKKDQLQQLMADAFKSGEKNQKDYSYYPENWEAPYKARRTSCGKQLYDALEIQRSDRKRRLEQWLANYHCFGAPVMMLFFIDKSLATGSYMDYGMFIQSVALAAIEEGLATCIQAALAEYPKVVRDFLGYPESSLLACGLSLGYEDTSAAVNSYRTPREKVEDFTRFFMDSDQ